MENKPLPTITNPFPPMTKWDKIATAIFLAIFFGLVVYFNFFQ